MSLKQLQTKIGITADGVFGKQTLRAAARHYGLSHVRAAHMFGQIAVESGYFQKYTENLNYSPNRLLSVFKRRFNELTAKLYAFMPEKLANFVYGNRNGNGDEKSGDGWKYRGRGALQLTGKANYQAFANYLGKPEIMEQPDLVATDYAFESALFYFERNGLWKLADNGVDDKTITKVTKAVNGGYTDLENRVKYTKIFYKWLTE